MSHEICEGVMGRWTEECVAMNDSLRVYDHNKKNPPIHIHSPRKRMGTTKGAKPYWTPGPTITFSTNPPFSSTPFANISKAFLVSDNPSL